MLRSNRGFTLIEMIGVLAVISILAAMVAPKIFEVIADSKATRASAEVNTFASGVAKWYKDIGSLQSLTAAGALNATDASFESELTASGGTAGLWTRWRGPYIPYTTSPAIGTGLTISTAAGTTAVAATNATGFDLSDDGTGDMATTNQVVALVFAGVAQSEFERVDDILDSGLTKTGSAHQSRGKVKWDSATGNMYIYIAHN
ncbi:MAG: prepilin-type N-terminal cleavage/methylation domain-containing protein [Nitrospinae bacterium]|nr:prepilin-type N-terminal cleavage/methylation domain-containing protein [Nitrospinota bacterium]